MIIFNEYTHYLVSREYSYLPLWIEEGCAEFYSTFYARKDRAEIGLPVESHVHLLQDNTLIPLGDLFAMSTESTDYNEGKRQGIFYAQSWALYHYLRTTVGGDQLGEFLQRLQVSDETSDAAFRATFGYDYRKLEKKLDEK